MANIQDYDKNYSEGIFLTKIDHIFIMLLNSIMDNNMESVKNYLSDEVYERYKSMTDKYIKDGYTRIFDEMNVKSTEILDINKDNEYINVNVKLISRYMDYYLDSDGNYVSGNNTRRIEKTHYITFTKKINSKTLKSLVRCPSCGHNVDINKSLICEYCDNIFNINEYDYVISSYLDL